MPKELELQQKGKLCQIIDMLEKIKKIKLLMALNGK